MYKMIVTDLDDTLLRTDKSISMYTIDVLKGIRSRGIKIIFATARGDSTEFLTTYDLFDGCVLTNGAKAYIDNRLVYECLINSDTYIPFIQELSNKKFKVAAHINGLHHSNFDVSEKWDNFDNFVITDFTNLSGHADKLYAIVENPNQIDMISSILPKELYLTVSRDNLAMIMHKKATKTNGIAAIADEFDILESEVIVFGDDINDMNMLQDFGLGVAMNNSIDEVKRVADFICDTNDNDGVAKWLKKNLEG